MDYPGRDMFFKLNILSSSACQKLCQVTTGFAYWTWVARHNGQNIGQRARPCWIKITWNQKYQWVLSYLAQHFVIKFGSWFIMEEINIYMKNCLWTWSHHLPSEWKRALAYSPLLVFLSNILFINNRSVLNWQVNQSQWSNMTSWTNPYSKWVCPIWK